MTSTNYNLDSGALCLDFVNTVDWRASGQPVETLRGFSDLIAWGEAAGTLTSSNGKNLRQLAGTHPDRGNAAFERAVQLRETLYQIFSKLAEGVEVSPYDLTTLNEALEESLPHLKVTPSPTGFHWGWRSSPDALDQVIWPVVRSAAELLTSEELDRVRQCADDRGCGYMFIDQSRNRSRRWCSMESCGNRAKARRHYKRQKKTG